MTERLKWKDATSYSRDGDREPKTWAIRLGDLSVTVTKGHIYHPGEWVFHCAPWFDSKPICGDALPAKEAQFIALDLVRTKLLGVLRDFEHLRKTATANDE